jgi:glycosyltransferase involved in cell wall biosynthesis
VSGTAVGVMRAREYDLVHAHCVIPQGVTALAVQCLRRVPFVYTSHGADYELQASRGPYLSALCQKVLDTASAVTAVDNEGSSSLSRLGADVTVVPNALRDETFKHLSSLSHQHADHPRLLFIGHVNVHKGIDLAIEALAMVHDGKGPRPMLDVLGGGTESAVTHAMGLARELGVAGQVRFWGIVPDVSLFLRHADLIVQPSRVEGMSTTVLEAFAARVPVVATAVGGLPDMLEGGERGYLVTPDSPSSLAEAVAKALLAGSRRPAEMLDSAFAYAKRHTASRVYGAYTQVYERVLEAA